MSTLLKTQEDYAAANEHSLKSADTDLLNDGLFVAMVSMLAAAVVAGLFTLLAPLAWRFATVFGIIAVAFGVAYGLRAGLRKYKAGALKKRDQDALDTSDAGRQSLLGASQPTSSMVTAPPKLDVPPALAALSSKEKTE